MNRLWVLLAVVFVVYIFFAWKRREGLSEQNAYELTQMQQGELDYINNQLIQRINFNEDEVKEMKIRMKENEENTKKVSTIMSKKDANKRKNAYPDLF